MTSSSWTVRGRLVTSGRVVDDGWVEVVGDRVVQVGHGRPPESTAAVVDLGDSVVSPGFVDLHVHGGGGQQVSGDSAEEVAHSVRVLAHHHARHGTTALLPTTVSESPERLRAAAEGVALAMVEANPYEPTVLGLHLEGPWISSRRPGAHDRTQLREPAVAELRTLAGLSNGLVRLVTMAPEVTGADALVRAGVDAGIVMSVGHTEATYEQASAAFEAGARHLTHSGNAMPAIDRRDPGPVAAAVNHPGVTLEVIADGHHLHPGFLRLLATAVPDRLVAVTDAAAACGMPDGRYRLGAVDVEVSAGRVAVADRPATLAGSVLTMDAAVATLVAAGVPLPVAITAATRTPADVLGDRRRGRLGAQLPADLVVLDRDLRAVTTVIGGVVTSDRDGRLASAGVPVRDPGSMR